ncbi:MAG TPA: S8 family peptidase [Longimicrobiaceae bacterium]|nr:S8 family peptidase [Longimicrobiaceae bacterium]
MRRALVLLLPLGFAACSDTPQTLAPADGASSAPLLGAAPGAQAVPGRYIVVFGEGVADAPGLAQRLTAQAGGTLHYTYQHAVRGFAASLPEAALGGLRSNPNVAYVEQDQVMKAVGTQTGATWGIDRIDARSGTDGLYNYAQTGVGVKVYVIDTGIRLSHTEFTGRVRTGYDAVTAGGTADDCNGHGTHVAGTVGGTLYGVAKAVELYAVRVLDCGGSGTTSGVIAGVDWVTGNHVKPAVANMSLGGGASSTLDAAVQRSIDAGVTYAIAAGNGDFIGRQQDACNSSPARVGDAITIGATNSSDAKASWSNYGNCVDFFAPGVSITSAWYTGDAATNTISGTSMAAPHVAGAAALYLEANPGATPLQVRDALYAATTKGIVTSSSTANNHLLYTGSDGGSEPTPPPPTAGISLTATGSKVKGAQTVDLKWTGAASTNVDVFRDGVKITTTPNDGAHTDSIGSKGGGTYVYKVCEAGTTTCSGNATVTF